MRDGSISSIYIKSNTSQQYLYRMSGPNILTNIADADGLSGVDKMFTIKPEDTTLFTSSWPLWPMPRGRYNLSALDISFSTSCWLRFQATPVNTEHIVLKHGRSGQNADWHWKLTRYNNGATNELRFYSRNFNDIDSTTLVQSWAIADNTWFWFDMFHDHTNDLIGFAINNAAHQTTSLVGGFRDWIGQGTYDDISFEIGAYFPQTPVVADRATFDFTCCYHFNYVILDTAQRNTLYNSGNGYQHP